MREAHIVAYEIVNGDRRGLHVCHSCDNPKCCNPNHLWLGTHGDNMADMVAKGRAAIRDQKGGANGNSILTADKVRQIRQLIDRGETNMKIGAAFGVHHATISKIRRGKGWRHLA